MITSHVRNDLMSPALKESGLLRYYDVFTAWLLIAVVNYENSHVSYLSATTDKYYVTGADNRITHVLLFL